MGTDWRLFALRVALVVFGGLVVYAMIAPITRAVLGRMDRT
jgi:hypothetical protein